jgi:hypothetical protein
MKKILSLLGTISMIATSSASVVACAGDKNNTSSLTPEEAASKIDSLNLIIKPIEDKSESIKKLTLDEFGSCDLTLTDFKSTFYSEFQVAVRKIISDPLMSISLHDYKEGKYTILFEKPGELNSSKLIPISFVIWNEKGILDRETNQTWTGNANDNLIKDLKIKDISPLKDGGLCFTNLKNQTPSVVDDLTSESFSEMQSGSLFYHYISIDDWNISTSISEKLFREVPGGFYITWTPKTDDDEEPEKLTSTVITKLIASNLYLDPSLFGESNQNIIVTWTEGETTGTVDLKNSDNLELFDKDYENINFTINIEQ